MSTATLKTQNIIIEFAGGLGNQLFQYACAQALLAELRSHTPASQVAYALWLDGTSVIRDAKRTLNICSMLKENTGLSKKHIILSRKKLFSLLGERVHTSLHFFEKMLHHFYPYTPLSEAQHYCFLSEDTMLIENNGDAERTIYSMADAICREQKPVFIQGFWQYSTMISKLAKDSQRDILHIPKEPKSSFMCMHDYVQVCDTSVSLHVRRTDYLHIQEEYPPCDIQYYKHAIAYLRHKLLSQWSNVQISVFIFSDDPRWCKTVLMPVLQREDMGVSYHLVSELVATVGKGKLTDVEELILMSMCTHHVLANSSFSWWGSGMLHKVFLPHSGNTRQGIVIAPKHWNTNVQKTRRIHMSDWVLL